MPDSFYPPDDPTERIPPRPQQQNPGQQDKLVLGNFQDQARPPERRPYQYQPQPPNQQPQQHNQQGAYPPSPQQGRNPNNGPASPNAYSNPNQAPGYPYPQPQPGQVAGRPGANKPLPRRRKRHIVRNGCLILTVLLIVVIIFSVITLQKVSAFGSAISTQAPFSTQTGYMATSDRTNLLIMGYGGGAHQGADLTDSMMVMSVLPQSGHTSLVSVPRDLWVSNPDGSTSRSKVNAIYEYAYGVTYQDQKKNGASDGAADLAARKAGGDAAANKVKVITGLDVKYWVTIDFTGFKKVIDAVGGVDVNVPDAFNACYPKNDDATVDASWIKVQFDKGVQHMDGATAIEYARAREPLEVCGMGTSENLAELTDFGRSARQQIIMKAVLAQVKQVSTWPHLYSAMDALQQTLYTNMSIADLGEFATKMNLNDPKAAHIGLSNQNVLVDSQTDDGQYILTAKNNDWNAIKTYVGQQLYQ